MNMAKKTSKIKVPDKKAEYEQIAQDTKLLFEAFLYAGFTSDQAFELMKLWVKSKWEFEP